MSVWQKISRAFAVDDAILDEDFSLMPEELQEGRPEKGKQKQPKTQESEQSSKPKQEPKQDLKQEPEHEHEDDRPSASTLSHAQPRRRSPVKPKKIGHRSTEADDPSAEPSEIAAKSSRPEPESEPEPKPDAPQKVRREKRKQQAKNYEVDPEQHNLSFKPTYPEQVSISLHENRDTIIQLFQIPRNADFVIREFTVSTETPIQAFAVFMEGMSDKTIINDNVLQPLMLLASLPHGHAQARADLIKNSLLPGNQLQILEKWEAVKNNILTGSTAVFVEGMDCALIVETKGWEHRTVSDTKTETVVRGPHDAFTENLRTNTGLVRARLRTEKLITEITQVGELAATDIAIMYVEGIVSQKLVTEVKRRIKAIKVDFLQDSGTLEQFIEDPPFSMIPRMLATERPDRVAVSLTEGYVAVFVGQSPYVLILPTMLWSLLHTAEDAYVRYPFGTLLRLIRFSAFLVALLLPALYIAVTNYHPEMIPTDLMLTIASSREKVPFPVVMEVLLMEVAIELIREAGIRIPNVIGPTIGIVGALILGQAAVQAGVVSPLLVIVVSVTALAAFTMPNYNLSFAVRTLRFVMILLSGVWGFYGITLGMLVLLMDWATMKSFGIPMLTNVSPYKQSSADVILRGRVFKQEIRPGALYPGLMKRQVRITRPWDPATHDSREAVEQYEQENRQQDTEARNTKGKRGGNPT
ncbi:spore germination protein [Tumebacillus permanentifrigoris]|uniref:Spore germination protein KA n=1 Tax=Tumebacillus permanentifrigoris TaxID=378543 RepID=A0A316D8W2_9BACL|nr:spore germination protein [Tumebacillus permanentifrigoris]PWK12850.1 spore germination protein KA [Tumebacillus permanentifrigoris]